MSIYLNASSHGLPDRAVTQRIIDHLELDQRVGAVAAVTQDEEEELRAVRGKAAHLLGAAEAHVGFSTSTLVPWKQYVAALPLTGKRLLVAPHEWGENIAFLTALAKRTGARVEALPPLDFTAPDLSAWQAVMDEDVAAIFLPMVTSVAGLRYPVEAIGTLERPAGSRIIVDAAQALGQVEVDVARLGCDVLFGTTRKWTRGPRQTAIFWCKDAKQVAELEPFDAHVGLRLGLGVALDDVLSRTMPVIEADLRDRTDHVRARVDTWQLPILSPIQVATGAATLAIPDSVVARVKAELDAAECIVKWPDVATDEPFSGLDVTATKPLRISPHISTSLADLDTACDAIARAL